MTLGLWYLYIYFMTIVERQWKVVENPIRRKIISIWLKNLLSYHGDRLTDSGTYYVHKRRPSYRRLVFVCKLHAEWSCTRVACRWLVQRSFMDYCGLSALIAMLPAFHHGSGLISSVLSVYYLVSFLSIWRETVFSYLSLLVFSI